MNKFRRFSHVLKWTALSSLIGIFSGSASAFFLFALDRATLWRESHPWILWLLPVGGFAIGWLYLRAGESVEGGNNLLIDEIHDPKNIMPLRMAPLILIATVATHFFGGSAGREGTAIQMGGSLADRLTKPFRLNREDRRILLMAGMSAGFGSVFGTPLAGAVFGLEVLAIGRLRYDSIFPCFLAAIIGDQVTRAWGIHHASFAIPFVPFVSWKGLLSAGLAGVLFGLMGTAFANATHAVGLFFKERVSYPPFRPAIGGVIVGLGAWAIGSTRYLGLGIPTMADSFSSQVHPWDFAGKFVFTVLTLGSGFKGGEVTPLFFIGATLGHALSLFLALPAPLLAAMGFVAVFAGAANTPLSSLLLAIEIFGAPVGVYAAVACVVSYLFSGHTGIYRSQRIGSRKHQ